MPGRTGGTSSGGGSSHSSSSFSSHSSHSSYSSSSSYGGGSSYSSWVWAWVALFVIGLFVLYILSQRSNSQSTSDQQVKATTAADIAIMEKGILPRLPEWQSQSADEVHHVSYEGAGLPADFNTKEVVYGYCSAKQFYVYVLNLDPGTGLAGTADSSGYVYLTGGSPYVCAPTGWRITGSETVSVHWYYVNIDTRAATAPAIRTATAVPPPTAIPTPTPVPY
jgi:hypothetical protein